MSNGVKTLREIGAQRIHNETHISRIYAQAIIHESFDGLQSVQLIGFLSILEREYNVDLSDLRAKAKIHFEEEKAKIETDEKIFVSLNPKTSYTKIYVALGFVLFLSFIYINSATDEMEVSEDSNINDVVKIIEKAPGINENVVLLKDNNETNTSDRAAPVKEEVVAEVIEQNSTVVFRSLKILPKRKVWAGYIDIETNKKFQKIFRKEFVLDISKNWLLLLGPGTVYLEVNGEKRKFSSKRNMRFKYNDGVFTKITVNEFKSLNKGRRW